MAPGKVSAFETLLEHGIKLCSTSKVTFFLNVSSLHMMNLGFNDIHIEGMNLSLTASEGLSGAH